MGGWGSGLYRSRNKKTTIEQSLTFSVGNFHRRKRTKGSGGITWTWWSGNTFSLAYIFSFHGSPVLTLKYSWGTGENIEIPLRLQSTSTNFNGSRWWFTCPLIDRGVPCNRRVGKVYLPPGAKYFGCRHCHNLTYRSCQESHQGERILGGRSLENRKKRLAWLDSKYR